ncbi:MAG TPA: cytochrome C [Geobacter sp.]|nr:cytochrome C [Geobacter sp.]
MMKVIAVLVLIPALLAAALFGYILVKGPRMTVQHKFREFQMVPPPPPNGTASVVPGSERVPAAAAAAGLKNPLQSTPQNLAWGQVYYQYYCVFCHGEGGAGNGPVGHSYTPRPADLRTPKVAGYSDGELLRASLTGIGHEPVLERVVPPEHRWRLLLFVRWLAGATNQKH